MDYRIEHDSMGEVKVPSDKLYGAQTQRSVDCFPIGTLRETMPCEIIHAFGMLKRASAEANAELCPSRMTEEKYIAIKKASDEVASGVLDGEFPLVVFQTGSGTQSNMNANEVIANRGNAILGKKLLHPNDDVNMSQSSNDTFPTAMHLASALLINAKLIPATKELIDAFMTLEHKYPRIAKTARTHLQDATPILFAQEVSAWRVMLEKDLEAITLALGGVYELALGGTAVGTGLNAPKGFDTLVAEKIANMTGLPFVSAPNKFHALTSRSALVFLHGALKALACDLLKIANDIRWLASGPRCGLGEIEIPENEPGSSIMPGKVNPTQCEALSMVAVQVFGNDTAITVAASQGNFQLNVYMPILANNVLQSARLLSDAMTSFRKHCVLGIKPNANKMQENLDRSLMLATALNPHIGYENAAKTVKRAHSENITLKEACLSLGFLDEATFDAVFHPENMV